MKEEKKAKAVALKWEGGKEAPRVTAKGEGALAEEILAIAKACDIPIQENSALAFALAQLELDEEIPEMLYLAVAEVIAFAYYVSGRHSVAGEHEA